MHYFKDVTNAVFAFDDEQLEQGYPLTPMTAMSGEEVAAHINPPKTAEQVESEQAAAAAQVVTAAKLAGVEFAGVMCSATKEDMWGLSAVAPWVQAGNSTPFQFDNGNVLVLTPANYLGFLRVWGAFRSSFFTAG
jgi:pyruvate/2-oxoacid:ferredoxin oxidoreductase alpha subunit